MNARNQRLIVGGLLLLLVLVAFASGCTREETGRYQLTSNGLRLDTVTGEVQNCVAVGFSSSEPTRWHCGAYEVHEEDEEHD
jgi:hypothetical protein